MLAQRLLALASWLLIAAAVVRLLAYGATVFVDAPLIDDWYFTVRLEQFVDGQVGIGYLFETVNGHFVLPGHVSILASYYLFGLNYAMMRWANVVALCVLGSFWAWIIARDVDQTAGPRRALPLVTFGLPPFIATVNLYHWELFSIAVAVNSFLCILLVGIAIETFDRWLARRSPLALAGTLVCAIAASVSHGGGSFVFLCLAVQLWLSGQLVGKARLAMSGILGAFLAVFLAILFRAQSGSNLPPHLSQVMSGTLIVSGASISPHVDNAPVPVINAVYGTLVLAFAVLAVLWSMRGARGPTSAKYIAIGIFGLLNVGAIAWGRRAFPIEVYASSRYAALSLPLLLGVFGLLALVGSTRLSGRVAFFLLLACVLPGLLVSHVEEGSMAIHRRATFHRMVGVLRDDAMPQDPEFVKKNFYVGDQFAHDVLSGRDFLRRNKLSMFR